MVTKQTDMPSVSNVWIGDAYRLYYGKSLGRSTGASNGPQSLKIRSASRRNEESAQLAPRKSCKGSRDIGFIFILFFNLVYLKG